MWLSRRITLPQTESDAATLGTVSIGGDCAAVVTDGEKRNVRIISPGGYCWQPGAGQSALVIKANDAYLPGVLQQPGEMAPGEVRIFSDNTQILLRNDGTVEIHGEVYITGKLFVNGREIT